MHLVNHGKQNIQISGQQVNCYFVVDLQIKLLFIAIGNVKLFSKIFPSNKNSAFSVLLPWHMQWNLPGFSNIRLSWNQLVANSKFDLAFQSIHILFTKALYYIIVSKARQEWRLVVHLWKLCLKRHSYY